MSDYCECGNQATFRCRCTATICTSHTFHPQTYHNTALFQAARNHEGKPSHALFIALHEAWAPVGTSCSRCYAQATDEVAAEYARAFRDHTDARPETIASVLLRNESWTTGREWHVSETVGQKTLRAAGHHVPWSHPDSLDTAGRLFASSQGEPPQTPIRVKHFTERRTWTGRTERVESIIDLAPIRAWPVSATYTDDGYCESATIFVGASGVRHPAQHGRPEHGIYFYAPQYAEEARKVLEGPFRPEARPGFFFTKDQAIAKALTSRF